MESYHDYIKDLYEKFDYIKGLYEDLDFDYIIRLYGNLESRLAKLEEGTYKPPQKPKQTRITSSDILFLASLYEYFGKHAYGDITIDGTTVTLDIHFYDDNLIEHRFYVSSFDISLCSKYYNKVSKFVEEVLWNWKGAG